MCLQTKFQIWKNKLLSSYSTHSEKEEHRKEGQEGEFNHQCSFFPKGQDGEERQSEREYTGFENPIPWPSPYEKQPTPLDRQKPVKRWPRYPNIVLVVMYFLSMSILLSWTCSLGFISKAHYVSQRLKSLHVALCCIGSVVYFPLASVYLFRIYVYKYHNTESTVLWLLTTGLGPTFLLSDGPRFVIEMHIVWQNGFDPSSVLQGISLIVSAVSAGIGFIMVWLLGLWQYTGHLQAKYIEKHLTSGAVELRALHIKAQGIPRHQPPRVTAPGKGRPLSSSGGVSRGAVVGREGREGEVSVSM